MKTRLLVIVVLTLAICAACFGQSDFQGITPGSGTRKDVAPIREASAQAKTITATFTAQGLTLSLTAICDRAERIYPFRAEIHAARSLIDLIDQVQYTISPNQLSLPMTDASTSFRFEGRQTFGWPIYAEVTLKRQSGISIVKLEGTIPYEAEVSPQLPDGLRFEDQFRRWYLEGGTGDYQVLRIRLRGEGAALNRIRSVEYQLPESHFSRSTVLAKAFDEYLIEDTISGGAHFEIVAVIRWKSGARSTHAISVRVP